MIQAVCARASCSLVASGMELLRGRSHLRYVDVYVEKCAHVASVHIHVLRMLPTYAPHVT